MRKMRLETLISDCIVNDSECIIGENHYKKISVNDLHPVEKKDLEDILYMAFYDDEDTAYTMNNLYRDENGHVIYFCSRSDAVFNLELGGQH